MGEAGTASFGRERGERQETPASGGSFYCVTIGSLFALGGVVLAVIGVESFNEYFDSQMGTDRVFDPDDLPPMAGWALWLGSLANDTFTE